MDGNTRENLMVVGRIHSIKDVPKTDNLQIATLRGMAWNVIINRNDGMKENDLVVYFSIDAMIGPIVEKMVTSPVMTEDTKTFLGQFLQKPIKTKRIRGVWSQGLIFPIPYLAKYGVDIEPAIQKFGQTDDYLDLTGYFGITKHVSNEEKLQYTLCEGNTKFPTELVEKTDEPRIQNNPKILDDVKQQDVVVTRKEDGTSATFIWYNGSFVVCSRNFVLPIENTQSSLYYEAAKMFSIEEKMKSLNRKLAIQGEIVGPKVNGNRLRLTDIDFRIFNIFNIDTKNYLPWNEVKQICLENHFHTVPELYLGPFKQEWTDISALLKYADTIEYTKKVPAEGIVIKTLDRSVSFKVVSNEYLLKNNL